MSAEDWDRRHRESQGAETPCSFLREVLESAAWPVPVGRALDIACGKGRNSIYLAARGFDVTAVDSSAAALEDGQRRAREKNLRIDWRPCDLESAPLPGGDFDLAVNFNYLQRSLFESIKKALRPGGFVIFETYLVDQAAIGHPKNPDYLLRHNELLGAFRDCRVLLHREGRFNDGGTTAFRASLFAQKP
jgi:SAM-dependent methyltransferase